MGSFFLLLLSLPDRNLETSMRFHFHFQKSLLQVLGEIPLHDEPPTWFRFFTDFL